MSDESDIIIPSELTYTNEVNNIPRKKYRSEAQKLNDSLTLNPPGSRLRPRR